MSRALLWLAMVCAACVGDRTPEAGAPAAIPVPVEGAAAAAQAVTASVSASAQVRTGVPAADSGAGTQAAVITAAVDVPPPSARPVFVPPEHVRALYLNAWTAGSRGRMDALLEVARRTEINSFVIDIKDASGYVSHPTGVRLARAIGATGQRRIRDLPGLLSRLEAEGVYPIARIVIVRDAILAAARPGLAVQDAEGGPWADGKGITWMNPASREVWDYNVDLAEEVGRLGFPEIQWDYVRFPDAPRAEMASARYPGLDDAPKPEVIRAFLEYADERLDSLGLDVIHTADVFGITTSAVDVGIGQVWERLIDRVDVALPMVYPSHYYRGSFGYQRPNFHPYEIVREALQRGLERSASVPGAGRIRPWLQDFSLGQPAYGVPEVRAQIQAAYDVGIQEWVLWNPGSRYTEEALQPEDGWTEEPRIRVADRIVPVSRRFEALRETQLEAAPAREPARAAPAPVAPGRSPAADRERPRVLDPDSLRRWVDSVVQARDTLGAPSR